MQVEQVNGVLLSVFGVWTEGTAAEVGEGTRKQNEMPV